MRSGRLPRRTDVGGSGAGGVRAGAAIRPGALFCAVLASLAGCRPEPAATRDTTSASAAISPAAPAAPVSEPRADSLALALIVPSQVRAGETVPIAMRVRNEGAQPRDLYLRGRTPTLDVLIMRASGDTVWRRLQDEVIPAILAVRTLGPGEELAIDVTWDQRLPGGAAAAPGDYLARGLLLTDDVPLTTAPVSFRVLPG